MKHFSILFSLAMLMVISSCSSIDNEQGIYPPSGQENTSGVSKAKERLVKILNNPTVKAAYELRHDYMSSDLSEGRPLDAKGQILTRANDNEARYYVFDIDDYGGYAIIGNSPDLPELIALSVGTDEISKGSQEDIDAHGEGVINLPSNIALIGTDSATIDKPSTEFDPNVKITRDSVSYQFVGPARPLFAQWGCEYPYNNMLPTDDIGRHANAGCVCIAIAQLLTYKDYQPIYNQGYRSEIHFNWDLISRYASKHMEDQPGEMCNVGKNHIAPLCSLLNTPNNLNPIFRWDKASLVFIYDIKHTLAKFGIYRQLVDYDINKVLTEMKDGEPVLISGGGHTWVIDAVMEETSYYTSTWRETGEVINHYKETRYLLHCNWGWDGKCNGYFYSELFNPSKRPVIPAIDQNGNQSNEPGWETENLTEALRIFIK